MKQVWPLIRIQLLEYFPFSAVKNTTDAAAKKRAKRKLTSTFILFFACVYMSGVYSMGMLVSLDGNNFTVVPALMLVMAAVLGAVSTLTKAGPALFQAASLDPLLPLPISRSTVILSRVFSLYFEELLINAGMLLTAGACCQIRIGRLPGAFWPMLLVSVFLAPLIPLGVGGLAGLFVAMLTARMKNKNLFTTIFSLLFVLAVMFLSFNAGTMFSDMSSIAAALEGRLYSLYPPSRLYVAGLGGSVSSFLLFAGISLACLGLLCLTAVKGFSFFYGQINASASAKAFRMGRQKRSGALLALCQKELKQKLNTPSWMLNTDMGTVMVILGVAALVVAGRESVMEVLEIIPGAAQQPGVFLGLIVATIQCMALAASASVSMEGKELWLIKSLPIQANTWFRSMLLVSMLPPAIGGVVSALVLTVALRLPAWNILAILGLCLLFGWAFSVVELALGLHFARFDWENPAEVVKQGAGVMFSVLITFLIIGVGVGLFLLLGPLGTGTLCLVLLAVALPIRLALQKNAAKILTKL